VESKTGHADAPVDRLLPQPRGSSGEYRQVPPGRGCPLSPRANPRRPVLRRYFGGQDRGGPWDRMPSERVR